MHSGKELHPSSCICKAHHIEAKRHSSQDEYIPKWKKIAQSPECVLVCSYPQCSVTANDAPLIKPSFQSTAVIQLALNMSSSLDHIVLCRGTQKTSIPTVLYKLWDETQEGNTVHQIEKQFGAIRNIGSSHKLARNYKICFDCFKSNVATLKSLGEVLTPNELLEKIFSHEGMN